MNTFLRRVFTFAFDFPIACNNVYVDIGGRRERKGISTV